MRQPVLAHLASSKAIVTESASENPAKPAAVASDPAVKAAPRPGETPKYFNLRDSIAKQREELRNVPGRTGILAEKKRYSLFDEELIIRDFFQDRRSGFFVDVGCAWPVMANNTAYLEKQGITKVDLLAMDIEGHELTALHGFDIERFRPDLVVTEGRRPDVTAYFAEHGYGAIKRYLAFDTVNVYNAPVEVAAE